MAEKPNGRKNKKFNLGKLLLELGRWRARFLGQLTVLELLTGFGICLLITLLLVGYQFQNIPDHKVGDVAAQTIEAPQDFTVEDPDATAEKRERALAKVPAVFNYDPRVNSRIEAELRRAFATGRAAIEEERARLRLALDRPVPKDAQERLLRDLAQRIPEFSQPPRVLRICLERSFSRDLEAQLVKILAEALKPPGVVENRDALLRYQFKSGIEVRNTVTGNKDSLVDWMAVRDLNRAKDLLRQNEFELTVVNAEEKKSLISFFDSWIRPNLLFSEEETRSQERQADIEVDPVVIQVKKGRTIVRAGDEITSQNLVLLNHLKKLKQPYRVLSRFSGILIIVSFFMIALWQYLVVFQRKQRKIHQSYLLLALILCGSLLATKVFVGLADVLSETVITESLQNPLNFYFLAPVAAGTILVILLIDVNVAVLFSVIFAMFAGLLTGQVSFSVYTLAGSLMGVYVLDHYRERLAIIRGGLIIALVNVITVLALHLYASTTALSWTALTVRLSGGFLSGLFAAMLASLLLPVLESLFEVTTDIRLLELSNLNKPILRRLAVEAPGTYHHSIVVGTLAEAAAEAIGANALLVRVGAYYHDIGKLKKASYYVENQIYTSNKHENLSPNMSSLILASHVKDGLALADEIGLAPKVRDLIPQHHGTRLMTYFYQKARDAADEKHPNVSEEDFRYPGPKPQSREAAILMLADQVEAAARTLQDPTPSQIEGMIKRLVQSTIQDGQFDECDITLKDLEDISRAFVRVIAGMHHHRIEYPGFNFNTPLEERKPDHPRVQ
ncbi:MAG: HDIG domain-containing protein [Acidobacteria bacterium]|nr:MAG: HDIG domain-containing protein [Acidobacteriota bacterium]